MATNAKTPKRLLKKGKIIVNAHNKATEFSIFTKYSSFHIRNFWITTVTFWICFFVWFGNINLLPWIREEITMNNTQITIAKTCLTLSTTIFRIIIGDLLDKIGSRYCYILVLILSLIPVCLLSFIQSPIMYIILNFFIGIVGASFAVTQYHTTQFFIDRYLGLAQATSAGWGNFGGGCAAIIMPSIASLLELKLKMNPWRYINFLSGMIFIF